MSRCTKMNNLSLIWQCNWLLVSLVTMLSDECQWTLLTIRQHWYRQWLGAFRQQAITWANVDPDLCRDMASMGHSGLRYTHCFCILFCILVLTGYQWSLYRIHIPFTGLPQCLIDTGANVWIGCGIFPPVSNHNKPHQSMNHLHNFWDVLHMVSFGHCFYTQQFATDNLDHYGP